jgi:hypothetical protein
MLGIKVIQRHEYNLPDRGGRGAKAKVLLYGQYGRKPEVFVEHIQEHDSH